MALPERVAQIYYTYGLFCSSYPYVAVTFALSVVLLCCYPLLNVPLPGNIPTVVNIHLNSPPINTDCNSKNCHVTESSFQLDLLHNETQKLPYVWVKDKPLLYIHQIIMRIGVSPWNNNLKMWDAFRAPLQEVFRLLETVRNHEDAETKRTLLHHCYHVSGVKRGESAASVLPEYGCLLLSPANLWQQNLQTFALDANILNTIFNYQNLQKGKVSIAEMAFGMPLRDSGVKRYPLRARARVLQYAVTIFYRRADQRYINSLSAKLRELYPLHQEAPAARSAQAALVYYPGQVNWREPVPLLLAFLGLFLYVYFSVRKIEFIRSKLGLAAAAVLTVAAGLAAAVGLCACCGFALSARGKEIFPYLAIVVGLENVLVLTKSVASTDARLDVKIRLAQGLSREGWSITKNLLTEITVLTVGLFTFVPFIQESSIFMIVSLLADFFVQMTFFATILGVEVRRAEFSPARGSELHLRDYWRWDAGRADDACGSPQSMKKSKSHPRLNGLAPTSPTDVVAKRNSSPGSQDRRVPKRIRLVNAWARTRFFQRAFMLWRLVWISMIVYNSGVVEYFTAPAEKPDAGAEPRAPDAAGQWARPASDEHAAGGRQPLVFSPLPEPAAVDATAVAANDTIPLKHSPHYRTSARLSPYHWSSILSQYNESVAGRYVVVLPPVLVSHRVAPELASGLRHPDERDPPPLRWQALAAALDPIDVSPELEPVYAKSPSQPWGKGPELPIYPTTPMEILLLAILCSISIAVIGYMMVVLYRCICSKHYAEWRASWSDDSEYKRSVASQPAVQLVMEAVPLVVAGHSQEVECLATDGEKIVSSCLQGSVKVWDSQNGELITDIDRPAYFKQQMELYERAASRRNSTGEQQTTIESCECPEPAALPMYDNVPRLRRGLSGHLKSLQFQSDNRDSSYLSPVENTKYQFAKAYRDLYYTDQSDMYEVNERTNAEAVSWSAGRRDSCASAAPAPPPGALDDSLGSLRNRGGSRIGAPRAADWDWRARALTESPVWCMDFCNDLVVLGCADGRLEFWEATTGKLICAWWFSERAGGARGVTHVRALAGARRVCAASLSGHLALLRLDAYNARSGQHVDWRFSTAHRRTHRRSGSAEALDGARAGDDGDEVVCAPTALRRAHQQPITELQCDGGRALTGGQDHVLKVFAGAELTPQFTLHGHCGPVSCAFIDRATPTLAGSGAADGSLCVWDLHTGACLYSVQAHDGAVASLAYTASYVVSAGADERLCVWDRFQGHLLSAVHVGLNYLSRTLPLTHSLLVAGDRGGLVAYDLSSGDVVRRVLFGRADGCVPVRQILPLKDAIVCDYANQLRIVRFPLVAERDAKNE